MASAVTITVGGVPLVAYTTARMSRKKADLTGSMTIELFFADMPSAPVVTSAVPGAEVVLLVGGAVAFTGTIDERGGSSVPARDSRGRFTSGGGGDGGGGSRSASIGKDSYKVTLSVRGKTKHLIGASHQHKTTNMLKPTSRDAAEAVVKPFGISLDWRASARKLDKIRFRDGAYALDELHRIATENGHFLYETRDGRLRFTDGPSGEEGEPLILGDNILEFSAGQTEEPMRSEIQVKGQRSDKGVWGEKAVLGTIKFIRDGSVPSFSPITIQHYGDSTPEALERRGRFEANKRSAASKTVTIKVFHVQSRTGAPWDVGTTHYVEVPPEGVFDVMECTGVEYDIGAETLETTLTLSPVPASADGGGGGAPGLASFASSLATKNALGALRRVAAGVTIGTGSYPLPWGSPALSSAVVSVTAALVDAVTKPEGLSAFAKKKGVE